MFINRQEIENMINKVIKKFNKKETYLMENNLCERCICSKFATYLHIEIKKNTLFKKYEVDVEYDRGYDACNFNKKRIDGKDRYLDLIVHERGYNEIIGFNNLICIEMKKSDREVDYNDDEEKLEFLTNNENRI